MIKPRGKWRPYFVNREIFICLGRILLLAIVLVTNSITGGFVVQAFASLAGWLF